MSKNQTSLPKEAALWPNTTEGVTARWSVDCFNFTRDLKGIWCFAEGWPHNVPFPPGDKQQLITENPSTIICPPMVHCTANCSGSTLSPMRLSRAEPTKHDNFHLEAPVRQRHAAPMPDYDKTHDKEARGGDRAKMLRVACRLSLACRG